MQKFNIAIDVTKIQKDRLRENTFTDKDGKTVKQIFCDTVAVPLKESKLIKSGDTWKMYKVGFLVEKGTKEEATNTLGDVIEFKSKEQETSFTPNVSDEVDNIPF